MAIKELKKASGLYTSVNSLGSYPEGAFVEAKNIVLDDKDIISSRRGFKLYGDSMGAISDTAKQLLNLDDRLIRHYDDVLEHETSSVTGEFEAYHSLQWNYAASGELTSSGTTATFNALSPHGLSNNDEVVISGATETPYNGTFIATVVDDYSFTYTMSTSTTSPATGNPVLETSTAHVNQVDLYNRLRSAETPNGNFFITTEDGVQKLDDVDGYLRDAGGVKALDVDLEVVDVITSEVFPQNSQLGYRILWGYKDLNNNIIYGTPSSRAVVGLTVSSLIVPDFNTLLDKIDDAAAVNTGSLSETNYNTLAISLTASAAELNAALKSLCSKLELDMGYVNPTAARYGRTGNITSIGTGSSPVITTSANHQLTTGDSVTLFDTNCVPALAGPYIITVTGVNTFTVNPESAVTVAGGATGRWESGILQEYAEPETNDDAAFIIQQEFFDRIVALLLIEPLAKIDAGAQAAGDFLSSTQYKSVKLTFSVPKNITTNYFYQIYRTSPSIGSDVDPGDDMGLVYETNPTAAEIIQGYIEVTDDTAEEFRGASLYTNPRQEGILQANEPPPFAKDIAIFQNCAFYLNTKTKHRLELKLLGTSGLSGTKINIAGDTYNFGASESTASGNVEVFSSGTPSQNLEDTAKSLVRVINRYAENTDVYAYYISEVADIPGQILIESRNLENDAFYAVSDSTTIGASNFNPNVAPSSISITNITAGPDPVITTASAHGLAVGGQVVLVNTDAAIDGLYDITAVSSNTFTIQREGVSSSGTSGKFKGVDSTYAGASDNEVIKNRVYYSKQQQYEAVPLLNFFDVGSGDKAGVRCIALRDSLFILKEDGIYRITGDSPRNFALSLFDNTTFIVGSDTAAVGSNQIYCFSNHGVVSVSDTGVSILASAIEDQLLDLISNDNLLRQAFALVYQTDRKYILFIPRESDLEASDIAYVYNTQDGGWVTWDLEKTCGIVNSRDDKLYLGAADVNSLEQERKDFSRTDFADRQYDLSVVTYDPDTLTLTLSSIDNLEVGDVLVQTQVHTNDYGTYNINLEAIIAEIDITTDEITILEPQYDLEVGPIVAYSAFEAKVQWAPDSLDSSGTMKQFREAIVRMYKSRVSSPVLGFSSDLQPSFEEVEFEGAGNGLWGYFNWGEIPWGGDSIQRAFRTYVPLQKQRCSVLNVFFKHKVAREEWQVEGLSLIYEAYSNKVNR